MIFTREWLAMVLLVKIFNSGVKIRTERAEDAEIA